MFTTADQRKIKEATIKLLCVELFGLVMVLVFWAWSPKLADSGSGLVTATLIGVASWMLCAEILSVIVHRERTDDSAVAGCRAGPT